MAITLYESPDTPLLLQFSRQADLIIVGRVISHSIAGRNRITELEPERIIASIWDEEEIRRVTVVEKRSIMLIKGKYLCWLKLGSSPTYFVPVQVATGIDSSESGIAPLNYLDEMMTKEDYARLENKGGIKVDLRALSDRRMQLLYGTTDRQELVSMASQCAKLIGYHFLMVNGHLSSK